MKKRFEFHRVAGPFLGPIGRNCSEMNREIRRLLSVNFLLSILGPNRKGNYMEQTSSFHRKFLASTTDYFLEFAGGFLGAYFGALIAALWTTLHEPSSDMIAFAVRSGVGFGFLFWFTAISFMNRVVYQGITRASIGKELFGLEIVKVRGQFTWPSLIQRWVFGYASFTFFGIGYVYAIFSKSKSSLHDDLCGYQTRHRNAAPAQTQVAATIPFPLYITVATHNGEKPTELGHKTSISPVQDEKVAKVA